MQQVPLAQLALLEREENKGSLVLQASRVSQVHPVHPEREANQETWVFQERAEQLEPLDPGVSEGSQESEEELDLRVFRVPVAFLEHLVPTAPREPSAQPAQAELKDPPGCRACQGREAHQASRDPKETGVITERKDQRGLQAKTAVGV